MSTSGRFDPIKGRVRPGTYLNIDSSASGSVAVGTRGSVLVPLIGHNWGPDGKIIKIDASDITAHDAELGASVTDVLLICEALKGAGTILAYVINKGTKASVTNSGLTVTAKYGGTRGNDIKVSSTAQTDGTYTVDVILDTNVVEEFESIADIDELVGVDSRYVDFSGTGALSDFASLSLSGATAGTVTNAEVSKMLDSIENEPVSAVCFPVEDNALKTVAVSKVKYLRDTCGKAIQVVLADYDADYEGVINVANSYARTDGVELTHAQATAYVAAITAAADDTVSNTYRIVTDADTVIDRLSNEETEEAIKAGKFVFTQDGENVIVEYDINSLHTFTDKRSQSWRKNKVVRVLDSVSDTIRATFPPNKFPNNNIGWDLMDGLCQTILQYYLDRNSIKDVDKANDMRVNRGTSTGDSVFFDAAIHPVDAAEKLYFSVITD